MTSNKDTEFIPNVGDENGGQTIQTNLDPLSIQKMLFIYNAVIGGWTVKMVAEDKYEFKRNKSSIKQVDINDYLKEFVTGNLSVQNITNKLSQLSSANSGSVHEGK